jgi:hypothetical protein
MKQIAMLSFGLALTCLLFLTACDDHGGSPASSTTTSTSSGGTNSNTGTNQTFTPTSLAGQTITFAATSSQTFSEPVGSTFTVNFVDANHFSYVPSVQNPDGPGPFQGTYTYDPATGTLVLSGTGLQETTAVLSFNRQGAGVAHLSHPDGGTLDATFVETSA